MSREQHIIDRFRVNISANNPRTAIAAQEQLAFVMNTSSFAGELEQLFDPKVAEGDFLEIDKLEFSFDVTDIRTLRNLILLELGKAIDRKTKENSRLLVKGKEFEKSVVICFLRFGILVSEAGKHALNEFRRQLAEPSEDTAMLIGKMISEAAVGHPLVWQRLYAILKARGLRRLFEVMFLLKGNFFDEVAVGINVGIANNDLTDPVFWSELFQVLRRQRENTNAAVNEGDMPGKMAQPEFYKAWREENLKTEKPVQINEQNLLVANAGIVLLWLEVGGLFRQLGYVQENDFVSLTNRQMALMLFHYLATGSIEYNEEDLVLSKILCNWPLHEPLHPEITPAEQDLKATDEMFEKFLSEWRKEKSYSAGWFRNSFLQRSGMLGKRNDGNWHLRMHKRTEDILLQKPSIIRYSWMKKMIFIDW